MPDKLVEDFKEEVKNHSSREVAAASDISHAQVLDIVKGKVKKPQAQTRRKIRAYLEAQARKEVAGTGRIRGEDVSEAGATAALEALADVGNRVRELVQLWTTRLELARSTPPAMVVKAGKAGVKTARRARLEGTDRGQLPALRTGSKGD